ncbi:MAG: hypothetical protein V1754_00170 [Pseudomonadota bacterium]
MKLQSGIPVLFCAILLFPLTGYAKPPLKRVPLQYRVTSLPGVQPFTIGRSPFEWQQATRIRIPTSVRSNNGQPVVISANSGRIGPKPLQPQVRPLNPGVLKIRVKSKITAELAVEGMFGRRTIKLQVPIMLAQGLASRPNVRVWAIDRNQSVTPNSIRIVAEGENLSPLVIEGLQIRREFGTPPLSRRQRQRWDDGVLIGKFGEKRLGFVQGKNHKWIPFGFPKIGTPDSFHNEGNSFPWQVIKSGKGGKIEAYKMPYETQPLQRATAFPVTIEVVSATKTKTGNQTNLNP